MNPITRPCPHCGRDYDISHRMHGDRVWCRFCGQWFAVVMRLDGSVYLLDREWYVMPGPQEGQQTVRLWALTEAGPVQLGELRQGQSLMVQQVKESGEE